MNAIRFTQMNGFAFELFLTAQDPYARVLTTGPCIRFRYGILQRQFGWNFDLQRSLGDDAHVHAFFCKDGHIGRQSGKQLQIRIGCMYDDLVRNHVGVDLCFQANHGYRSFKEIVRKRIHGKLYALSDLYLADVCLVNICNNTHFLQIFCDGKHGRRAKTCSDGLSFIDGLGQDNPIDGRIDGSVA